MVRAYQKPGSQSGTYRYCSSCEEWDAEGTGWSYHTIYVHDDSTLDFYDNDDCYAFYSDCSSDTAWEHDDCSNWFRYSNVEERALWVCGECKETHSTQDAARECCA